MKAWVRMKLDQQILNLGSAGQLGKEYLSDYAQKNIEYFSSDESNSQITKYDQIYQIFNQFKPRLIINYSP